MNTRHFKQTLHVLAAAIIAVLLARSVGVSLPLDHFFGLKDFFALIGLGTVFYVALLLIRNALR